MATLLGFVMPGPMELAIILAIMLLLFGGAKLPSLMRNIGKSVNEFKKGVHEIDDDVHKVDDDVKTALDGDPKD